MADIAEAFEQHLKSLSDDEWSALQSRVRTEKQPPPATGGDQPPSAHGPKQKIGLDEARRRGYITDEKGKP